MKMKLSQLLPNPFRNLSRYPISRSKVEALKASIRTTGFWDNLVVRRVNEVWTSLQRLKLFDLGVLKRDNMKGISAAAGRSIQREVSRVMKTHTRAELEALEDEDQEQNEHERKAARKRVCKVGEQVGAAMVDHLMMGKPSSNLKEVAIQAQIEAIPSTMPEDERKLSTIDAAARAIHARDFQRKIEMLLKYKAYMSPGAKHELAGTLKEVADWIRQMLEGME